MLATGEHVRARLQVKGDSEDQTCTLSRPPRNKRRLGDLSRQLTNDSISLGSHSQTFSALFLGADAIIANDLCRSKVILHVSVGWRPS
jgi:hypothetical protein